MANTHAINWFEIPVTDFDRARRFYETIFARPMPERTINNARMAFFDYDMDDEGRGGAIVCDPEFYAPCSNGPLLYLNAEPDIQKVIDRVATAGGKILTGRTKVAVSNDLGYWAIILDSEGNRIALHAAK